VKFPLSIQFSESSPKTLRVREADGSISYYDAPKASKPVVMPGGIWV
jgi:hypothetical protein